MCLSGAGVDESPPFLSATLSRVRSTYGFAPSGSASTVGNEHESASQSPSSEGAEKSHSGSVDSVLVPIIVWTKLDEGRRVAMMEGALIVHENAQGVFADPPLRPRIFVKMPLHEMPQPIQMTDICAIQFYRLDHSVKYGDMIPGDTAHGVFPGRIKAGDTLLELPKACEPPETTLVFFLKALEKVSRWALYGTCAWTIINVLGVLRVAVRAPQEIPRGEAE